MPVLKNDQARVQHVKDGVERKLMHLNDLMMTVIDFNNGPWDEPEPMHRHVHEQITYVAEGVIIFFCEGEQEQWLKAGDMFSVPSNRNHTIQLLSDRARLIDGFNPLRQEFLD
jgi:quercetin dioxygenase-like cupin family protein